MSWTIGWWRKYIPLYKISSFSNRIISCPSYFIEIMEWII
nr:MAG TPA: hypothetical protein [Bacteriophage sp.]